MSPARPGRSTGRRPFQTRETTDETSSSPPRGMALLAMASVGLWTLRVALTARGRKSVGAAVAAVEAVVFAVAFTNVAAHLDSPFRIAGYAAGVAFGTVLGLTVDRRLSAGVSEVDIIVPGRRHRHRRTLASSRMAGNDLPGRAAHRAR